MSETPVNYNMPRNPEEFDALADVLEADAANLRQQAAVLRHGMNRLLGKTPVHMHTNGTHKLSATIDNVNSTRTTLVVSGEDFEEVLKIWNSDADLLNPGCCHD